MEVSRVTAIEIFTNPSELYIVAGEGKDTPGKYGFAICRGPGHRFKPMITCEPCFASRQETVASVADLLAGVVQIMNGEFTNPDEVVGGFLNPDNRPLSELLVLTAPKVERISAELLHTGVVQTDRMFPVAE